MRSISNIRGQLGLLDNLTHNGIFETSLSVDFDS